MNSSCATVSCRRAVHQLPSWGDFAVISMVSDWLVGAGGIEPPNGGIKIRCLTAWLRPNTCTGEEPRQFALRAVRTIAAAPFPINARRGYIYGIRAAFSGLR